MNLYETLVNRRWALLTSEVRESNYMYLTSKWKGKKIDKNGWIHQKED